MRYDVTTAIPYVNGRPHVGHALELVQTDVLARHRRQRGDEVRFQSGTDDNALKNVQAAEAEGLTPGEYVAQVAARFAALSGVLELSFDDFIRTSADPRHRPGVERLWRASAARGDLYRKTYAGLYCVGCEQFYTAGELVDGWKVTSMARPPPGTGRAVMVAAWAVAMARTMDRPRPWPPSRRAGRGPSRWKGWNRRSTSAGGMTCPELVTDRTA